MCIFRWSVENYPLSSSRCAIFFFTFIYYNTELLSHRQLGVGARWLIGTTAEPCLLCKPDVWHTRASVLTSGVCRRPLTVAAVTSGRRCLGLGFHTVPDKKSLSRELQTGTNFLFCFRFGNADGFLRGPAFETPFFPPFFPFWKQEADLDGGISLRV